MSMSDQQRRLREMNCLRCCTMQSFTQGGDSDVETFTQTQTENVSAKGQRRCCDLASCRATEVVEGAYRHRGLLLSGTATMSSTENGKNSTISFVVIRYGCGTQTSLRCFTTRSFGVTIKRSLLENSENTENLAKWSTRLGSKWPVQ